MSKKQKKKLAKFFILLVLLAIISIEENAQKDKKNIVNNSLETYNISNIKEYKDKPYVILNNNKPNFLDSDYTFESFETYSDLDNLNRANVAFANIGIDLMPTEKRGSIGNVKPTGWHTVKYDNIESKYLYNRCHLIGYQLTGENANKKNLITCTRQMNTEGMLEFENKVASYIKETKDHVLYRVTPIYKEDNLLANGVIIEASSVADKCGKICFNVFVYNVQNGISIDYKTGISKLKE